MKDKINIKGITTESIKVRKSKVFSHRNPLLKIDNSGEIVLLVNDIKEYMKTVGKISILLLCIIFNMSTFAQDLSFQDLEFENGVFAEWKTLKYGYGEPGNIPDINGSKNGPILKQLASGGISTSTGDIYNPRGISQFKLTDTVDGYIKKIAIQVWSTGVPIDYDSFTLTSGDKTIMSSTVVSLTSLTGEITLVNFELEGNEIEKTEYSINFNASNVHMSLVAVRLDLIEGVSPVLGFKDLNYVNSEYAQWDTFTIGVGDPGNQPDVEGSRKEARLTQTAQGAMATGSGNIYNPGGISKFVLTDSIEGNIKNIALQIWTIATPVNYESFILKTGESIIKGTRSEVGVGDSGLISLINFDLGEAGIRGTDYSIEFETAGPHSSLVAARLDVDVEKIVPLEFKELNYVDGEYAQWETFTIGVGDPGNEPDFEGSKKQARLTQTAQGAMATGSGNIYNPGGISKFVLTDSVEGNIKNIALQIWTIATPVNYESFIFKTGESNIKGTRSEIGVGDSGLISLINFDLDEAGIRGTDYSIEFETAGPHSSLVAVRLDVDVEKIVPLAFKELNYVDGEYSQWETFTIGVGDPGNEPDVEGSRKEARLTQTAQGAMATGSGNIYNPGGISKFVLTDSIEGNIKNIGLQIWTIATPVNYESFILKTGESNIKGTRSEIGVGDSGVISLIDFDLGEAGINGTDYSIEFETAGPHSSLVAAKLDLVTEKVIFEFENINLPGWQFDGWEIFASAYDEWNVADMPGSRDFLEENSALLKQTEDGSIITSTGNIYNPVNASRFNIQDTVLGDISDVILQVHTSGSTIKEESVELVYEKLKVKGKHIGSSKNKTVHGYEYISKFSFNLGVNRFSKYDISFSAPGPHMSLVAIKLDKLVSIKFDLQKSYEVVLNEPTDDRWTYPRNSTPGSRNLAPVFGFISGEGETKVAQKYGQMVVGFDTSKLVPIGLDPSQYLINSAVVEATVALGNQFKYDGTYDDYENYINNINDKLSPVELYATGFRNGYNNLNWVESSPLTDSNSGKNNVYSLGYYNGEEVDVDVYNFAAPHNAKPFSVGNIEGINQGDLVPEDSIFSFIIDLSDDNVMNYISKSLSEGKIFFTLSQLLYESLDNGGKGYPDLYTKDHILGEGPKLNLDFKIIPIADKITNITITRSGESQLLINWDNEGDLQRSTVLGDDAKWTTITTENRTYYTDTLGKMYFYRISN